MMLLVSPVDELEALEAVAGGADIIDVKNPAEGSLGANFPWVIRRIRAVVPRGIEVSATVGDVPDKPGTVALAALGAAVSGANYVKIGLYGVRSFDSAVHLSKQAVRSVKEFSSEVKVVLAGYADAERVGAVDPFLVPSIVEAAGADVAMVDTAVKDGLSLLDLWGLDGVERFVSLAKERGLTVALAGSLRKEELPLIVRVGADIVGVRGAACEGADRLRGRITRTRVEELVRAIREAEKGRACSVDVKAGI
ncbi:MAG: (5-formylfuran-3-yl)methyl phosphate synthase [Candidatus Freyarchaeota archaeon]